MHPSLSDKSYLEARKMLARSTRVDALACIHLVQRQVADAMLRAGAEDSLTRLTKSDLVETLLAKAARVICLETRYVELPSANGRERFIEAHLRLALVAWLGGHVKSALQLKGLNRARRILDDDEV